MFTYLFYVDGKQIEE